VRPLAIDLYCGLGGWTEGLLAEAYDVIGFDIERHVYGDHRYPAQLVLQDVTTLHGQQFKDAALIVGSSPCQEFSWRGMPWKAAKIAPPPVLGIELFNAQFRIQREASEAAGRHIPMVVENVRNAQPFVGRARWHYGSYYLWGDVPALMPIARKATKVTGLNWSSSDKAKHGCFRDSVIKNHGGSWFRFAHNTTSGHGQNPDGRLEHIKQGGDWFQVPWSLSNHWSSSPKRKFASALIAKIPFELARYIARVYKPITPP